MGYYYNGEGIGTTCIGSSARVLTSARVLRTGLWARRSLEKRKSDGYYGQMTYKFQD